MNLLDEMTVEPPDTRKWSEYQQAVFDAAKDHSQDTIIQAVAGSGKTITIIEAMKYAPGQSLFMAFNKAIAEDIRSKATSGEVKTLNALGHSLMLQNRPEAQMEPRKMLEIVKKVMGESAAFKDYGYTLSRVCGLAKGCGFGIDGEPTAQDFADLIDAYSFDIPCEVQMDFAYICREAFELSRLDTKTFDFDDQLWVPVYEKWTFPTFDTSFVDECQDLSPIQHIMLERLKLQGSRIIAVGDRHQAIYGFRGASTESMDLLKAKFQMKELPLSISYRCPQLVVEAAQQFCPTIKCRDGAPQGSVQHAIYDPQNVKDFELYMILCRSNAPMFAQILRHVRERQPCQVMSSFLDSFQGFVRSFKARYTSDLSAKLDRWYERESAAAKEAGKKGKLRGLQARFDTLQLLCKEYTLTEDIIALVKSLGYSKRGPIFATIHKSKGLEHDHIYILRPDLLGGFGEMNEAQKQQEDNLHYVAITRAKSSLTYGASPR